MICGHLHHGLHRSSTATKENQTVPKRWQRREVKRMEGSGYEAQAAPTNDIGPPPDPPPRHNVPASDSVPQASEAQARHRPPDPCPVCLEGFSAGGDMPRTCRKCKNNFHQACLAEWAKKEQQIKWEQKPWMLPSQFDSGTCPCCRSSKGHDKSRRWKK